MPTVLTKTIAATNSPTTPDYSSLAGFIAALPANLVTADQQWIADHLDQGKFTAGGTVGGTTDATRNIILRCRASSTAGFNQKSGVRTTALTYDSTTGSGVAYEMSAGANITLSANYTQFDGIQAKQTGYSVALSVTGTNCTVSNCILDRTSGGPLNDTQSTNKFTNCLIIQRSSSSFAWNALGAAYNCTFVNAGGTPGTSAAVHSNYNVAVAVNCAFFGFGTVMDGATTLAATSDYNVTDLGSIPTGGGGGSHNTVSQTFALCFIGTTVDFRAASGSVGSLLHRGTPDSTNAPKDISLTNRDATNPYAGAWEVTAAAAGSALGSDVIHSQALRFSTTY